MSKLYKRGALPEVAPVIINQIEYSVIHWGDELGERRNGGYVVAKDLASNSRLWVLKVYTTVYDERKEMDAQDVFISKLAFTSGKLRVVDELERQFMIDLETRAITQTRPKPNPQQKRTSVV